MTTIYDTIDNFMSKPQNQDLWVSLKNTCADKNLYNNFTEPLKLQ